MIKIVFSPSVVSCFVHLCKKENLRMTQYSFHCTHTDSKVGVVLYRYVFKRLTYLNRFVPDIPPYYAKRITLNRTYYLIWSVAKTCNFV